MIIRRAFRLHGFSFYTDVLPEGPQNEIDLP